MKPGFASLFLGTFFLSVTMISCTKKSPDTPPPPSADRGRVLYQTQCIACHNPDPHKPGSIGPDVFGSSKELLEARILKASYPEGYKPKKMTRSMAPLPHLKNEIESIHIYLNSTGK